MNIMTGSSYQAGFQEAKKRAVMIACSMVQALASIQSGRLDGECCVATARSIGQEIEDNQADGLFALF